MTLDGLMPFTLSTPLAARALEYLFALSAGIQTLEYLRMRPAMNQHGLWSWAIQRQDIPNAFLQLDAASRDCRCSSVPQIIVSEKT